MKIEGEQKQNSEQFLYLKGQVCPRCQDAGGFFIKTVEGHDAFQECPCRRVKELIYIAELKEDIVYNMDLEKTVYVENKVIPGYFCINQYNKEAYNKCMSYIDNFMKFYHNNPGMGLIIAGPVETGKTVLANLIAKKIISKYFLETKYIHFPQYADILRQAYTIDDPGLKLELEGYKRYLEEVPVLVIDDLGAENTTPFIMKELYLLLDARMKPERILITTMNYTIEELAEKWQSIDGDRILSRLQGMCFFVWIDGRCNFRKWKMEIAEKNFSF